MVTQTNSNQGAGAVSRNVAAVAVAGLLHDIGVLWRRTGDRIPPEIKTAASESTPAMVHAHWSAAFVARHANVDCQDTVIKAVSEHHDGKSHLGRLLNLAGLLAAGGEGPSSGGGRIQLRSVLAALNQAEFGSEKLEASGKVRDGPRFYVPLHPLAANRAALFPTTVRLSTPDAQGACKRLWRGLLEEHASIPLTGDLAYANSLWWLLRKYTWCTPSVASGKNRDTSLFDHLRLTAAIAVSLTLDGISDRDVSSLLDTVASASIHELLEKDPWNTRRVSLIALRTNTQLTQHHPRFVSREAR